MRLNNEDTIGTTAVKVVPSLKSRTSLVIYNAHPTAVIYYGSDSKVTTGNGIPIEAQTKEYFNAGLGDRPDHAFYLVSDTLATNVRWGEFSGGGL